MADKATLLGYVERGLTDREIGIRMRLTQAQVITARYRFGIPAGTRSKGVVRIVEVNRMLGNRSTDTRVRRWIDNGWLHTELIRTETESGRTLTRQVIPWASLWKFLEDPAHWARWDVELIPDPSLRAWARKMRHDDVMTIAQAAAEIGVSKAGMRTWLWRYPQIPVVRRGVKRERFLYRSQVEALKACYEWQKGISQCVEGVVAAGRRHRRANASADHPVVGDL